jgi:hypothetical protein
MEKTKENLKARIIKAIASGDVEQMKALSLERWMRSDPRITLMDPKFQEWLKSDEVKEIRAYLDAEY